MQGNEKVFSAEEDGLVKVWMADGGVTMLNVTSPVHVISVSANSTIALSGEGDNK